MGYRRNYHQSKQTVRNITVKYDGKCACCGATIKAGEFATYYPPGTVGNSTTGLIGHLGGLEGNGARCYGELKARQTAAYVSEGLGENIYFCPSDNS